MKLHINDIADYPDYVILHDGVYDLRKFDHPGGKEFMVAFGTDATLYYHTMHPHHTRRIKEQSIGHADVQLPSVLEQFKVGEVVRDVVSSEVRGANSSEVNSVVSSVVSTHTDCDTAQYTTTSDFAQALKEFSNHNLYADNVWWTRAVAILTAYALIAANLYSGGVAVCIAYGAIKALAALCIGHDAAHGAVSRRPIVNTVMSYVNNLAGVARILWINKHNMRHHIFTNNYKCDPDTKSNEPLFYFSVPERVERSTISKYQMWYLIPVMPLYSMSKAIESFTNNTFDRPRNEYVRAQLRLSVIFHFCVVGYELLVPLWLFGVSHLPYYLLQQCVASLIVTSLFIVSHNFENVLVRDGASVGSVDSSAGDSVGASVGSVSNPICWYRDQVESSCTYGGKIAGLLTGGLNYQIEHHLFPRMNSIHYPRLHEYVRKVCEKHGVIYTYFPTFIDNLRSTIKAIAP